MYNPGSSTFNSIRAGPRQHRPIEGQLHEQHVYRRAPRREARRRDASAYTVFGAASAYAAVSNYVPSYDFTAPESSRRRRVASHLRETERYILKQSYYVALRHDSYTC